MAMFNIVHMEERNLYTDENCMYEIKSLKWCTDCI